VDSFNPEKVDIFNLGVLFFMLLYGCVPFHKADAQHDSLYSLIAKRDYRRFLKSHPVARRKIVDEQFLYLIFAMLHNDP